jgi:hypothetical protein
MCYSSTSSRHLRAKKKGREIRFGKKNESKFIWADEKLLNHLSRSCRAYLFVPVTIPHVGIQTQ